MNFDDQTAFAKWFAIGIVPLYVISHRRLVHASMGVTLAGIAFPAMLIGNWVGGVEGLMWACVVYTAGFYLLGNKVSFWVVNPLVGVYLLHRVQRQYGPKTKRGILDWLMEMPNLPQETKLDIAAIAKAVGEDNRMSA